MALTVTPHLNFRAQAREALAFYHRVFGGELMAVTYAQAHAARNEADADLVMFGQVEAPSGFRVMAYDVPTDLSWDRGDRAFFVSIQSAEAQEISMHWQRLAEGATIQQDLAPSGWSPLYGMLTDRFGVTWVMSVVPQMPA
ncbi:VOC family protein [Mitsuaria sp. GD03876]|uniref:VOC family protein n=1 Tax=Mitsuaria sp. GD03876 TaxID=2975399 RepID=UPI00244D64C3|nr:VOC family protein [Mitsuaria sp. GD03876]MDH0867375.1 VOC family protein [Mitsuaria sp. GD03876]